MRDDRLLGRRSRRPERPADPCPARKGRDMALRLNTPLCRLLDLNVPIVQAPIGSASTPALVAAVANAGGLGMLSITWSTPEATRAAIRETRRLTSRPFGINLVLQWDPTERLTIA